MRRQRKKEDAGKLGRQLGGNGVEYRGGMCGALLGTASRSIFPCLKSQRLDNGCIVGAFRGYGTGDEGSRSWEAKLRGDFPSRGLFILVVEEVSALPLLLEPGGKQANYFPQEQGSSNKLDPTGYSVTCSATSLFLVCVRAYNIHFVYGHSSKNDCCTKLKHILSLEK